MKSQVKHCYKITFIKYVNAKFAFSFIDTSLHYCDLIEKIPDCKLILIQNGRRQGKELEPFIHRAEDKFKSDYYFVFNKEYAEYVQRYISTKFVVGGSILNNRYQKEDLHENEKPLIIDIGDFDLDNDVDLSLIHI